MPGSTVSTQNKKLEADKPKGYFLLDTETKDLKFFEIENTRPVVYIDLKFKKGNVPEIKKEIEVPFGKIGTKYEEAKQVLPEDFKLPDMLLRFEDSDGHKYTQTVVIK